MKYSEQFLSLNEEEMLNVNGGDFAYDFGFFLRELGVFVINGGAASGTGSVALDLALNYKPLH